MARLALTTAEKRLGLSHPNLSRLIDRHKDDAPTPDARGLYDFNELRAFYLRHGYNKNPGDLKSQILEEELRLKRVKADEAEKRVISRTEAAGMFLHADMLIESLIVQVVSICTSDKKQQNLLIKMCKSQFTTWRKYVESLHDDKA